MEKLMIRIGDELSGTAWTKKYPEIEFADYTLILNHGSGSANHKEEQYTGYVSSKAEAWQQAFDLLRQMKNELGV